MIQLMSDDFSRDSGNFRKRIEEFLEKSANHQEKIPFLFIDHYEGDLPKHPPEWIDEQPQLSLYWKIARTLAEFYSLPLRESFGSRDRLLNHADRYRSANPKPDHRLRQLARRTDRAFKGWCRGMETYLGERRVRMDSS